MRTLANKVNLVLPLKQSLLYRRLLVALYLCALVAIALIPYHFVVKVVLLLLWSFIAYITWRDLSRANSVEGIQIVDDQLFLDMARGDSIEVQILAGSVVTSWCQMLKFKSVSDHSFSVPIKLVLLPDSGSKSDLRKLRVWLLSKAPV